MDVSELRELALKDPSGLLRLSGGAEMDRAIEMLWDLARDDGEPKPVRKSAKRALYILKSKGADIDRLMPRGEKRPEAPGKAGAISASFLSAPDSLGENLIMFVLTDERGLTHTLCQAILCPFGGVRNFTSMQVSKKFLEKLLERNREDVFPVPADYARFRLHDALENAPREEGAAEAVPGAPIGAPPGGPVAQGLEALPEALRGKSEGAVPHPALSLFPSRVSRILQPDEERRLFAIPEIARLSLAGTDVPAFKEQVEQAKSSRLIVGNRSPDERIKDVLEQFYRVHFTAARSAVYGRMVLDAALFLHEHGMAEEARMLVDYGESLVHAGANLKNHPLVRYLVYKEFLLQA